MRSAVHTRPTPTNDPRSLAIREEERRKMARELHDQIIQSLIGLSHQLSNLRRRQGEAAASESGLGDLRATLRQIQEDVRRLCRRPSAATSEPVALVPTIQSYIQDVRQSTGLQISIHLSGDLHLTLAEEVSVCLLRIVQETLVNIQKHAAAQRVAIQIILAQDEVSITIQDDGVGFPVPPQLDQLARGWHFGLIGMRERLEELQGSFHVLSAPGQGTCVHARVPTPCAVPVAAW
jgi:two-component system sensor histidine kinase DegS